MVIRNEVIKVKKAGLVPATIGRQRLTTADVAKLLNLHANTVRRWSATGILKACRISPGRHWRYRREDIEAFLRKGEYENYHSSS